MKLDGIYCPVGFRRRLKSSLVSASLVTAFVVSSLTSLSFRVVGDSFAVSWASRHRDASRVAAFAASSSRGPVVDAEEVITFSSSVIVGSRREQNSTSAAPGLGRVQKKVAMITGGSTGIGLSTVEGLARSGQYSTIIMAGRDALKHDKAMEGLRQSLSEFREPVELRFMSLDLGSLQSVRDFVAAFLKLKLPLHTLLLNAGVMALPERRLTADGFEYQFGVNHLAHFLVGNLLLDTLVASGTAVDPSRVIALSSSAHSIPSPLLRGDFGDLQSQDYSGWTAYGQSKLANLLFAYELDRRCRERGLPVAANAVHPGVVSTELARYLAGGGSGASTERVGGFALFGKLQDLVKPLFSYVLKTPEDGAKTSVLLATRSEGKLSGRYWQNERPAASIDVDPTGDLPALTRSLLPVKPRLTSYDPDVWAKLWRESEILVGLKPAEVKSLS